MYQLIDGRVEALEFMINSPTVYTNIPLKRLSLKPNNLIACIARDRKIIIPNGEDCMCVGDSVIVITMEKQIQDIMDILQ
jgi:trk system potassium uptake protein TrkA